MYMCFSTWKIYFRESYLSYMKIYFFT